MAAARAMRLAVPSTRVSNVSAVESVFGSRIGARLRWPVVPSSTEAVSTLGMQFDFGLRDFSRSDRNSTMNGLPIHLLQHGRNATAVLGPNPVQFEAVGDKNGDLGKVVSDLCGQGFDPRVELLLGQFLGQLVNTGLPQALADVSQESADDWI
jgi:hypothetical protein